MRGYKLVDKGIVNQYKTQYKLNHEYVLNGKLKYSKNGFHFSIYPEETLRFADRDDDNFATNYMIVEIEADGEIECGDDYLENIQADTIGVYASTRMTILRVLQRKEVFNMILNSNNPQRVKKYIMYVKLTDEEIDLIKEKYDNYYIGAYIDYYQYKNKLAFKRTLK